MPGRGRHWQSPPLSSHRVREGGLLLSSLDSRSPNRSSTHLALRSSSLSFGQLSSIGVLMGCEMDHGRRVCKALFGGGNLHQGLLRCSGCRDVRALAQRYSSILAWRTGALAINASSATLSV